MRLYNAANLTKYDDSCHADTKMRAHPQKFRRKSERPCIEREKMGA